MARVDLTVRGGGVFGLSIAFQAARAGARVRLIETRAIGAGASGGLVGALSPHAPEGWTDAKEFQLQALLMAAAFWGAVEAASGLPTGYARVGRLQPLADAAAAARAQARAEAAVALWRGQADWRVVPATGSAWEPASPTGLLIHDTLSARLHPRLASAALVAAIRALGGEVVLGEAADEGAVIHATGVAGLAALSAHLGRKAGDGVKGQALSLAVACPPGMPQLYAGSLHLVPHVDGTLAIGSTSETAFDDGQATDAQLDALHARAIAALPVLAGAPVVARWAGVRPRAVSKAPLLGAWPGRPGHFVANGGFKIGFGLAPLVALRMTELALTGQAAIPAGFRP